MQPETSSLFDDIQLLDRLAHLGWDAPSVPASGISGGPALFEDIRALVVEHSVTASVECDEDADPAMDHGDAGTETIAVCIGHVSHHQDLTRKLASSVSAKGNHAPRANIKPINFRIFHGPAPVHRRNVTARGPPHRISEGLLPKPQDLASCPATYASWVKTLAADEIAAIYARFKPGQSLSADFKNHFGLALDEETLNDSHQIVIVAATLDPGSERIVAYLNNRGLAINVLFFQVFNHGNEQLLSRAWLIDPGEVQVHAANSGARGEQEPWNGEFYVSFGADQNRRWDEAAKFGFISGGGGTWYSNSLRMLAPGDRVWANIPGEGFVGVGRVIGPRVAAAEFMIGDQHPLEVLQGQYLRQLVDDLEKCEYFVPVQWPAAGFVDSRLS